MLRNSEIKVVMVEKISTDEESLPVGHGSLTTTFCLIAGGHAATEHPLSTLDDTGEEASMDGITRHAS